MSTTAPIPNTVPFDLGGLEDLARKASPQLAAEVNTEIGAPETPAVEPEAPAAAEPETPAAEAAAEPETPAAEPEKGDTAIADELEELNRQSEEAKAKKTAKPEPVAEKKADTPAPTDERDKDLKLDERVSTAMHPKTKKIIDERNQKIIAERNKAEALAKEKQNLEAELAKIREEAKKTTVPKEVQEELTQLRQRIRELDITKDPALEAKYDKPVRENQDKILSVLQEYGLGMTKDGKPDPETIETLKKSGMSFSSLSSYIKKLSDAGEEDAAETVRELLRENIRYARAKEKEISEWKGDFEGKKQQTQQLTQQQQEKTVAEIRSHAERILNSDIAELAKDFPFINRPPEPDPKDSPAVVKAKQDAIAAYDAAAKAISESVAQLDPAKAPPEKAAEVNGRITASAVQGIILRQHVLPRLAKDLAELKARNAELEVKVGKIKTAGTLSRAHAAAATAPAGAKAPLPESTEDAAKQIAREMGVPVD